MEHGKEPSSFSQNSSKPQGLLGILAFFSYAAFVWLLSRFDSPRQERIESPQPQGNTNDAVQRRQNASSDPIRVIVESFPPSSTPPHQCERHERWKNRREWGIFLAQIFTAVFAFGLLCVTYRYVKYTYNMWREMQKATIAAQQSANAATAQLETTDRPWIKIVPKSLSSIIFEKAGLVINMKFNLINVGRSVATDVTRYGSAFIPTWGAKDFFDEPLKRQAELCRDHKEPGEVALFPGDTTEFSLSTQISAAEMQAHTVPPRQGAPNPVPPGQRIDPVVFGCVDYRFASLTKHHQTGFIYTIVRIEPNSPGVPYFIIIGQNLPANRLKIQRWGLGGDYAN